MRGLPRAGELYACAPRKTRYEREVFLVSTMTQKDSFHVIDNDGDGS